VSSAINYNPWQLSFRVPIRFPEKAEPFISASKKRLALSVYLFSLWCLLLLHWYSCGHKVSRVLTLGNKWTWAVSFTPRSLYSYGKRLWYSLDRRLSEPAWTPWWWKEKALSVLGIEPRCTPRSQSLHWLNYTGSLTHARTHTQTHARCAMYVVLTVTLKGKGKVVPVL
jgi:hypothetical protein